MTEKDRFEEWYLKEHQCKYTKIIIDYAEPYYELALESWQACSEQYEARIAQLEDDVRVSIVLNSALTNEIARIKADNAVLKNRMGEVSVSQDWIVCDEKLLVAKNAISEALYILNESDSNMPKLHTSQVLDKASLKRMMEKHNPDENINRLNRAKRIEALYSDEHIDAMEYGYMLALETLVTAVCGVENKPTRDFTPEDNKAIKEFYTDLWSERVRFSL
jgi:hypothetical protein